MPDQPETVPATRIDVCGEFWIQPTPAEGWHCRGTLLSTADLEASRGPTRPVRIVTTDADDGELRRLANARLGWPACAGCGTALTRDDTSAECNRCVTTAGEWDGPEAEARARVAYLEGRLADERMAHAKTQELAGVWPTAGLTAKQEIRARALDAAMRLVTEPSFSPSRPNLSLYDVADQMAGWIRDGSVPGEPT